MAARPKPKELDFRMRVNFPLLRKQKLVLLELLNAAGQKDSQVGRRLARIANVKSLEGIVHMLDAIQDQAVDRHGLKEHAVFGFGAK